MSSGKKNNRNIEMAIMAMAEKVRFGDPSINENELEGMMFYHDELISNFEVESFVYSLKYIDLVVLLFRSLDVKVVDIASLLKCQKLEVYESIDRLKLKAKNIV